MKTPEVPNHSTPENVVAATNAAPTTPAKTRKKKTRKATVSPEERQRILELRNHRYGMREIAIDLSGGVTMAGLSGFLFWLADFVSPATAVAYLGIDLVFAVPPCLWAAHNASYAVRVDGDRLRLRTLRGEEEWVLSDIRTMSPLVVRGVRCGVVLEDSSGERLQLDWTGLVRFGRILAGLQQVRREASSTT